MRGVWLVSMLLLTPMACGDTPPAPPVAEGPLEGALIDGPSSVETVKRDRVPDTPGAGSASGPHKLDFHQLARWNVPLVRMPFELPSAPESLTELDGKAVTIAGYVVPDQTGDGGRLQTALFIKHLLACCFGTTPKLNEWVQLEIADDAELDFNWRRPARVHGTFEVGPHKTGEIAQALYRIKVQRIVEDPEYGG